jgi:hypothetical protein
MGDLLHLILNIGLVTCCVHISADSLTRLYAQIHSLISGVAIPSRSSGDPMRGLRLSPHTFLTLPITSSHRYFTVLDSLVTTGNVIVGLSLYHFRDSVDSVTSHRIELRARWCMDGSFGNLGTLGWMLMQMQMQMQLQTKPKGALQTCTSVHVL